MKFVHIADMHFDTTFNSLNEKENLSEKRRLEQREVFNKVIDYIKLNKIPFLFISGDLYEQKYVRESTIEYINNKFKEIIDTRIFISPGNHDPFLKNSYYNNYNWATNVKIFKNMIEKVSVGDVDVYGYGFNDFYCESLDIETFEIENNYKLNVLVVHGSLDASNKTELLYNPMSTNMLRTKNFDYIALGHIHKSNLSECKENILYPGSLISMGFDELGEHGMIVGDITKDHIEIKFESLDPRQFVEYELDITDINSKEALVESLNNLYIPENYLYKVVFKGTRNFEINQQSILYLLNNERILKLKDNSKIKYNLEALSKEISLKGLFVKILLEKLESGEYVDTEIEKAIEIGLEVL